MDDFEKPTFESDDFSSEEPAAEAAPKKKKKEKAPSSAKSSKSSKIRLIGGIILLSLAGALVYQFAFAGGGSGEKADLVTTTPEGTEIPESSVTPSAPEEEPPEEIDPALEKAVIKYLKYEIIPSYKLCSLMTEAGQESVQKTSPGAKDCQEAVEEKTDALKEIASKKEWKAHKKSVKKSAKKAKLKLVSLSETEAEISVKTKTNSPISKEKSKGSLTLSLENGEWLVVKTSAFG